MALPHPAPRVTAAENPWTPPYCSLVAMDTSAFCYYVCAICERTLRDPLSACCFCSRRTSNPGSRRVYRLLVSVGAADRVVAVVFFDRAARVLMGCSADEWAAFVAAHPSAMDTAGELLQGEILRLTLVQPKWGNAQHLRATSVVPLRSGFRPVIDRLRRMYEMGTGTAVEHHCHRH